MKDEQTSPIGGNHAQRENIDLARRSRAIGHGRHERSLAALPEDEGEPGKGRADCASGFLLALDIRHARGGDIQRSWLCI